MAAIGNLPHLLSTYGYWVVGGIVALESMGLPLPGEATLIAAAIYAGSTRQLNIWLVITAAAIGAILGDNIGYGIGREIGYRLLLRYGHYLQLTDARIKLGQYFFSRHGGKIVFLGRFIALLRALAALLAGVNRMSWPRFLLCNAAGAILWATVYGGAAYYFGHALEHVTKPIAFGLAAIAAIVVVISLIVARRRETELEEIAERALPGPLPTPRRRASKSHHA
jgi:membrane protein DedA with SNARE-associated domain